jgi:cytochrome P450
LDINYARKQLTENEVIAQAFVFLLAGYFTTFSALAYFAYDLALNPDIQQKLYDEINGAIDSDGEIPYDVLTRLPYLEAVFAESLRLHSGALPLARLATTDYKLGDTGITIKAGQQIEIPIYAMHLSEQYFPDPYKFDPGRFMPENKHNIKPYTYLPFGAGPRNCIGMRFALIEIKICMAHLIRRYRFYRCPQTDVPIEYKRFIHVMLPKRLVVGFEKRIQ